MTAAAAVKTSKRSDIDFGPTVRKEFIHTQHRVLNISPPYSFISLEGKKQNTQHIVRNISMPIYISTVRNSSMCFLLVNNALTQKTDLASPLAPPTIFKVLHFHKKLIYLIRKQSFLYSYMFGEHDKLWQSYMS